MILVIGGAFQGKEEYAQKCFPAAEYYVDGTSCEFDEIFHCDGILHFHQFIRRFMDHPRLDTLPDTLEAECPNLVLISDELGYGVVPVDAFDRAWREKTGRICTRLAKCASEVHRVVAGIGMVIKHA